MDLIIIFIVLILTYSYLNLYYFFNRCENKNKNKGPENIFNNSELKININLAKDMLKKSEFDTIIDVRHDRSWIIGHHPDAMHITTSRLESILPDRIYNRKNKILVYGQTKEEAKEAAKIIKQLGYINVKYIEEKYKKLK
jgi:rhodanese-related sulfurtransferase